MPSILLVILMMFSFSAYGQETETTELNCPAPGQYQEAYQDLKVTVQTIETLNQGPERSTLILSVTKRSLELCQCRQRYWDTAEAAYEVEVEDARITGRIMLARDAILEQRRPQCDMLQGQLNSLVYGNQMMSEMTAVSEYVECLHSAADAAMMVGQLPNTNRNACTPPKFVYTTPGRMRFEATPEDEPTLAPERFQATPPSEVIPPEDPAPRRVTDDHPTLAPAR